MDLRGNTLSTSPMNRFLFRSIPQKGYCPAGNGGVTFFDSVGCQCPKVPGRAVSLLRGITFREPFVGGFVDKSMFCHGPYAPALRASATPLIWQSSRRGTKTQRSQRVSSCPLRPSRLREMKRQKTIYHSTENMVYYHSLRYAVGI
jgi:hypothetical protein